MEAPFLAQMRFSTLPIVLPAERQEPLNFAAGRLAAKVRFARKRLSDRLLPARDRLDNCCGLDRAPAIRDLSLPG